MAVEVAKSGFGDHSARATGRLGRGGSRSTTSTAFATRRKRSRISESATTTPCPASEVLDYLPSSAMLDDERALSGEWGAFNPALGQGLDGDGAPTRASEIEKHPATPRRSECRRGTITGTRPRPIEDQKVSVQPSVRVVSGVSSWQKGFPPAKRARATARPDVCDGDPNAGWVEPLSGGLVWEIIRWVRGWRLRRGRRRRR